MKKTIYILLLLLPLTIIAQTAFTQNKIEKIQDGIYFMYFDTSSIKKEITKSTIIEFKDFIALIDMPIVQEGGGAKNLKDHYEEGNQIIETLKIYFPKKPLKYILSSHWHPHSISSVLPFIKNKTILITTKLNFEKIKEFVDSTTYNQYKKYIFFVENDSFIIEDKTNKIVIYRITQKDYPSVPTKDFLYFYFPKYNIFNSACMYWRLNTQIDGRELIYDRLFDLNKFLTQKKIQPSNFTRYVEDAKTNGLIPFNALTDVLKNGISKEEVRNTFLPIKENMSEEECNLIIKKLIEHKIPNSIINTQVYEYLNDKKLKNALSLAKIQTLINPADANVWDTYGEVLYFNGEVELATYFAKQSQLINPNFNDGGEKVWKEDLEFYQKRWTTNKK